MHNTDPVNASSHNLKRLFMLRNLMIAWEILAILAVHFGIGIELPLAPLSTTIALLALVNLCTWPRIRNGAAIRDYEFFLQLSIDVLALTSVLYFTGGATNPFAWLFLIPLIIAATVLSARATWLMATLTTTCYTLLMFNFQPLGGNEHIHHNQDFTQHVFGMWFGFVLSAALISWFVVGMANTLRSRDRLLAQVREQALRDEQLIALGTLATGAAHELGTPLATMAVVTRELERTNSDKGLNRKFTILRDQVERCKKALSVISASAGEARAESGSLVSVSTFLGAINDDWRKQRPDMEFDMHLDPGPEGVTIVDEYTLHQSLANLFNNAADASTEPLVVRANWDSHRLEIQILDRGPGLRPQVVESIDLQKTSRKEYGMGLGLFLTHATIRRLGGDIELFDRDGGGTCTHIHLPLSDFGARQ